MPTAAPRCAAHLHVRCGPPPRRQRPPGPGCRANQWPAGGVQSSRHPSAKEAPSERGFPGPASSSSHQPLPAGWPRRPWVSPAPSSTVSPEARRPVEPWHCGRCFGRLCAQHGGMGCLPSGRGVCFTKNTEAGHTACLLHVSSAGQAAPRAMSSNCVMIGAGNHGLPDTSMLLI